MNPTGVERLRLRFIHLIAAAVFWLVAALIWMLKVVPKVAIADIEE
jgi:hypothetical protein